MKQTATFKSILCFFISLFLIINSTNAQLVINEISSRNATMYKEGNRDYEDFIEVYNTSPSAINLNNYYLSNVRTTPLKWRFFSQTLNPYAYSVIFADGENAYGYSNYPISYAYYDFQHTNFKIALGGETIYLSNSAGTILDSLVLPKNLDINQSVGKPLGSTVGQVFYDQMTPNAANTTTAYTAKAGSVTIGKVGTKYTLGSLPITVTATCPVGQTAIYTTNCNNPKQGIDNTVPSFGLIFDTTTVIKARCVGMGLMPGTSRTETFIFNENTTLPIVAISTDSANLWDYNTGILVDGPNVNQYNGANWYQEWRRASRIEYFDVAGVKKFTKDAAINTDGNSSIAAPKKSLRVNFNHSTLGDSKLVFEMFPNTRPGLASFKNIKVRAGGNVYVATNYGGGVIFHDGAVQAFARKLNVPFASYKPAVVYLNGKYWGMYEIRERLDASLYKNTLNANEDSVVSFDKQGWDYGPEDGIYNGVSNQVATDPAVNTAAFYNYFDSKFDIKNFYDYMTTEIHFQNGDWIGPYGYVNNLVLWRDFSVASDKKYRFSLKDFDVSYCISYTGNYLTAVLTTPATNPLPTMFKKLILNDRFKKEFINRYADVVNFYFNKDTLRNALINYQSEVQAEIVDECNKWPTNSPATWDYRYQNMLGCMDARNVNAFIDIDTTLLGGAGMVNVTLQAQPADGGKIQFSTITPNLPWTGKYFKANEIPFTAIPRPGYDFVRWETNNNSIRPSDSTTISLDTSFASNTTLTAVFVASNILNNKLLSFDVKANDCNVIANWTMDTDEDIIQYEVQKKSAFDADFKTVNKTSSTKSLQEISYKATNTATGNVEQYRLKITDNQGFVKYSDVLSVKTKCTNFNVQIQTNPVVDDLVLSINNAGANQTCIISIYNAMGQLVNTRKQTLTGNSIVKIPVTNLGSAIYALNVSVGNENTILKFLKK
jgi:hypothetical protein